MKKAIALESICASLVILFLYTAISKYIDFDKYAFDMHNQPFPHWLADALTYGLPRTEIVIALLLVFPRTRTVGLYASLILMSLFTIYTAIVLFHFFPRVPCSCGGVIKHLTWTQHAVFNTVFVALAAAGIYLQKSIRKQTLQATSIVTT